jgi:hypothetical protein
VTCGRDPLRATGLLPEAFVAPQSKVSTFSFVAPRLVEEFLVALPVRVLQQAPSWRFGKIAAMHVEDAVRKLSENEPLPAAMPRLVNPCVQIGLIHGREAGDPEGRRRGNREMSQRQVERKFPGLGKRVSPLLGKPGSDEVLAFGEALLFMETPEECLAWLRRACGKA